MNSAIRDALAATAASADPTTKLIGATALEYLETRNRELVAKMPQGGSGEAGGAASLAISSALGHPDSEALLELVALLIGERRYRDALVHPPDYRGGVGNGPWGNPAAFQAAFQAVLAAARRVSVPDEEVVRYFILEHHQTMDAHWITPEGLPFGCASDPRIVAHLLPETWVPGTPSEEVIWALPDEVLGRLTLMEGPPRYGRGKNQTAPANFLAPLAKSRPAALKPWIDHQLSQSGLQHAWIHLLNASGHFDQAALEMSEKVSPHDRLVLLMKLSALRGEPYTALAREASFEVGKDSHAMALAFLADHYAKDLAARMLSALAGKELNNDIPLFIYKNAFGSLAKAWNEGGREVFEAVVANEYQNVGSRWGDGGKHSLYSHGIHGLLSADAAVPADEVKAWAARAVKAIEASGEDKKEINSLLERFWSEVANTNPQVLREELFAVLGDKLKTLRQLAVAGLRKIGDDDCIARAATMLASGKADQKLGAAALLGAIGSDAAVTALKTARENEQNDKVRAAIHESLADHEKVEALISPADVSGEAAAGPDLATLEVGFAKQATKLKLPSVSWLKAEALPPVFARDGSELSKAAIAFLVSKQAKHKNIEAAPDALALLSHIDRTKSAAFGVALVEGFLNSEQAAADRWALTLGGLLGDNRIIPPLLSRINDWCANARHKLAEYSAQAISLLPGNEPLMVLDTLANRYRSKFKNVGKACAEAFSAAAAARGITPDELGDMVVPDFGFDADGLRLFEWEGGKANAELGADFKLAWFDPDSEKSRKALPASAPDAVKNEVKTLTKLLKEAVKGQTARLEMTLVRQRRWPVARWRELYENHPLLRSFASSLVWGIYDASGTLIRTFRRYPNGLLANAAGDLEELPEEDTLIGMVHPLEMEAAALDAWRAHLARFKVKQPFPQIDRPVELMDPLHGNRREITLTNDKKVGAGTFKSRSEKRGWYRGSVIDGGGISSIYKPFPGAGYEVILPTDSYYMGIDPMESVGLESAYFVKADSVGRGSYTYDEPGKDDPRVLRFDEIPAVVYSETMSDLKAIIGA